ncbi:uncharacterized protein EI90DRAFT_3157005 [Cantharellus anzutake]|uniref:uncharacterized protein n=1 Tax=Cantharellus anzutake TaxID=1750568 RepID=UPI0019048D7C|nr:uncharacterized protein EI90DRAFT_3157005 [Cantharellus anzutake]KAF8325333.1 hypothetical protein EI90DRAFT_3157005 [Cantharellus anzutake]
MCLAGEGSTDEPNVCEIGLSVYTQSPMKDNAEEDVVAYVAGALIIINEGQEAIDGPNMIIDATTVENIGIRADELEPSSARLATAHFVGQVTTIADGSTREFGLNVGTYSAKAQLRFEARLHFDDSNRRFDNFRVPRPGSNVSVQAKWMTDSAKRTHWMIENITYLGALPVTAADSDVSNVAAPSSKRKRLFGAPMGPPDPENKGKGKAPAGSLRKKVGKKRPPGQGMTENADEDVEIGDTGSQVSLPRSHSMFLDPEVA